MENSEVIKGLRYSLYLIFHPFDAFWDLKHEKKGNVFSAALILLFFIIVLVLRIHVTGFQINEVDINSENIIFEISSLFLPFLLWCVANWAITTLFEGEGSLKDIFIASAYALVPVVLLNIPMLFLSNVLSLDEMAFYRICDVTSILWAGLLIIIAVMTVHQFKMLKTIFMIILTVLTMIIVLTIILLFLSLITQIYNFVYTIYIEILLRY